jgi:outer membrane protein OmpA-like peptidoglycan-associated protein
MKIYYLLFFFSLFGFSQHSQTFYFDFDKAALNSQEQRKFNAFYTLKDTITIEMIYGYCDVKGSHDYNDVLSEKRANHLFDLLQKNGFQLSENLEIKAFGKRFEQNAVQAQNRKTVVYFSYIAPKKEEPIILIPPPEKEITEVIEVTEDEKPTLTELFDNAKKGDTLVITDIHFFFDSDKFKPESEAILEEFFYNLASYPPLEIEIQAHICCNPDKKGIENLSEKRAKALYRYLVKRGIAKKRLAYKSFGSTRPIYPIPEKTETERQANRRVEIYIRNK